MLYHPRSALAAVLADALQGKTPFSDAPNGLFLAAPRRTGKSTFLQADLIPELGSREVVAVYVDLWADQHRDPHHRRALRHDRQSDRALRRIVDSAIIRRVKRHNGIASHRQLISSKPGFEVHAREIAGLNGANPLACT